MDNFKRNILIQEELFKLLTIKALNINHSFYYGVTIRDNLIVNMKIHITVILHINDNIFNNLKEFHSL